ncbi:hypothetical protein CVT26_015077 [Gymnopilus dilepis]|uniref:Uncharacterized protein n=1 Tax=Gymnopilus dilepis TaxID=231916 RepID=A0A409WQU9_9AGAR|nr:hypothetical protein CVT26_015077 [Gymnopilus dilepis]
MPVVVKSQSELLDDLRARKREWYYRNLDKERARSRRRAQKSRETRGALPPDVLEFRKKLHREAQARYREKHRLKLRTEAWEYRLKKKNARSLAEDEEEYQRLMSLPSDN